MLVQDSSVARSLCAMFFERPQPRCYHHKASSLFPRAGGLDGRIQRKNDELEGDGTDDDDNLSDAGEPLSRSELTQMYVSHDRKPLRHEVTWVSRQPASEQGLAALSQRSPCRFCAIRRVSKLIPHRPSHGRISESLRRKPTACFVARFPHRTGFRPSKRSNSLDYIRRPGPRTHLDP